MKGPYCLLFSGQGTQSAGLCADLWKIAAARETLNRLKPFLGADIEHATTHMPAGELALTYNAQRAIHAHHLGHWFAFQIRHPDVELSGAIGHSMGVVAALVAAEALSPEDSAFFIQERAKAFHELCASLAAPAGLAAVSADSIEDISELLRAHPDITLALHNTAFKCVVAGSSENLEVFASDARMRSMRVTLLQVQGPYHTKVFAPCREKLKRALKDISIRTPRIPLFMGTSGRRESEPARIRDLLAEQACAPERHLDAVRSAYAHGCRKFLEVAHQCQALSWIKEQLINEEGGLLPEVELFPVRTAQLADPVNLI